MLEIIPFFLEALGSLFNALLGILELLDLVSILVDIFSWVKSKPSRQLRKAAKRAGTAIPSRSGYHIGFLISIGCSVLLSLLLIWKIAGKF